MDAPCTVTQLTPRGRGAVATIRVDGADARALVASHLFHPSGKPVTRWPNHRALKAVWRHRNGTDEDIVAFSPSDTIVEIHGHGGDATMRSMLQSLEQLGCALRDWNAWVREQDAPITRREAWLQLPYAQTEMTALGLLDQFHGALDAELIDLASDPHPADMLARLQILAATYALGKHFAQPWKVALGGPPNAGKSSLLNRILGYDRALVFDMPGTTRDVLHGTSALAGWPIEFQDTPGWRGTAGEVEQIGIERGQSAWHQADFRLLVLDGTEHHSVRIAQDVYANLVLWNKIDLPSASEPPCMHNVTFCKVSARTGEGLDQLLATLGQRLPAPPLRGQPVLFTERQYRHVVAALESCTQGDFTAARDAIVACRSFGDEVIPASSSTHSSTR